MTGSRSTQLVVNTVLAPYGSSAIAHINQVVAEMIAMLAALCGTQPISFGLVTYIDLKSACE
ncbi:hypothetical protein DICVIV_11515 [Dictyocaulus viviparus]|uniref:Uncharacterized protein n=1 Tax=Dictyocaulus viviparus TaxID=29172 RepID=A0A0D8XCZ1_DICVI|nr:hypothetical protein DICVIV_11515 [Dictyocaulus viviparus]